MSRLGSLLRLFGVDARETITALVGLSAYWRDRQRFLLQRGENDENFRWGKAYPCLSDRNAPSGSASGHYFYQDLWCAQRIFALNPRRHLDVGSRVDGFVAHVASFRVVEVMDIRPLNSDVDNVLFTSGDLMGEIPANLCGAFDSVSCLHALEHFGLGRYGDAIDPDGHIKGFENLALLLEPRGRLFLSVPIGPQRIEFNAHRVFSVPGLLAMVSRLFEVERLCCVGDNGSFYRDLDPFGQAAARSFDCSYGLGILELVKR